MNELWVSVKDTGAGISLSTSGNYHNPVIIDNHPFYHIYDPKTGWPIDNHLLSVSILFPSSGRNGLADGLSTASAVLGAERALPIIGELGGEALFLLSEKGEIREIKTPGWDRLIQE